MHYNLDNSTYDPLKYTMSGPILIASMCMGKSVEIQIKGLITATIVIFTV